MDALVTVATQPEVLAEAMAWTVATSWLLPIGTARADLRKCQHVDPNADPLQEVVEGNAPVGVVAITSVPLGAPSLLQGAVDVSET